MKPALPFALSSLVLLVALPAFAAPPSAAVTAAKKTLDQARTTLAEAVKRIQVDPPSNADLDAANTAVNALKDAIDAGASHEPENLEYAKAALAARKELRTQREYVDQRRSKVQIFDQRRLLDAALATLKSSAQRVEAKEPASKDFDDARAAARALRKALGDARPLASQDEKFASYLTDLEATLSKQEKAVDDRWVLLSADKHRGLVEQSRKALATAMAALVKGATDEQFKAAEREAATLEKLLEEGKPIEAGEKGYRAYADQSRSELAQSKKRMDTAWSETGLERLKAEIEPAHKDLIAAGRAVRARKPTADQLAEARTASIVVRKLVEKFQPEAARSQAFGKYVEEVKKTLVEVEVQLQLRGVDAATSDVKQALRPLERRAPTDDQFAMATSALLVLEKTLETVHAKDPAMAPTANDAKSLLRDGRAAVNKRRLEVDVDLQKEKVEAARKVATTQLGQANPTAEQLDEAEKSVKAIGTVLEQGAELIKKSREYAAYDREIKKRIGELNAKLAARRGSLAAADAKAKLGELVATAKAKLEALKQPTATDADQEAVPVALEAIGNFIDANLALENSDRGYFAASDRARAAFFKMQDQLGPATLAREVRKKTGDALSAGLAAFAAGEGTSDLRAKRTHYEKALVQFTACKDDGGRALAANEAQEKTQVLVDGTTSSAKSVVATCTERATQTAQLIKPIEGLIAFEEGPKRTFEAAKRLASQGKKAEAAKQFDECTASGLILQHRHPAMKDQSYQVAGGSMTLSELIKQCTDESRAYRGK